MEEGLANYDGTKINEAWALSMKETVKNVYGDIFVVTDRYNEVTAKIKEETRTWCITHLFSTRTPTLTRILRNTKLALRARTQILL